MKQEKIVYTLRSNDIHVYKACPFTVYIQSIGKVVVSPRYHSTRWSQSRSLGRNHACLKHQKRKNVLSLHSYPASAMTPSIFLQHDLFRKNTEKVAFSDLIRSLINHKWFIVVIPLLPFRHCFGRHVHCISYFGLGCNDFVLNKLFFCMALLIL